MIRVAKELKNLHAVLFLAVETSRTPSMHRDRLKSQEPNQPVVPLAGPQDEHGL